MSRQQAFFPIIAIILTILLLPIRVNAQQQTTIKDSLYFQVLKEQRNIQVVLPKGYDPKIQGTYEIVYCLDDISNFLTLEWDFLQGEGFIPKNMIMVGIANPKPNGVDMRDRDFTPTKTWENTGGAELFMKFMKTELLPFINSKYGGANTGNVLYGGSLGGLFVMYAFFHDPGLFTSYIAIDPSLWWDNQLMTKIASSRLPHMKGLQNTLFIAGREGNAYKEMGIAGMDSVLQVHQPIGVDWKIVAYKNETHYSTNFQGFWDGLKFSYGGFYASTGGYTTSRKIVLKPKTGVILKDVPFRFISYNLLADKYLHYTTDGTMPDKFSPLLSPDETSVSLEKSSKIIVKSIGARSEYNRADSAYFEAGDVFKSIPELKNAKQGGLHYAYYTGTWNSMPDVKNLKPAQTGITESSFDVNKFQSKDNYVCMLTGYLKIDRKGYYIIEMGGGNKDSKVYLNGRQILGKYFIKDEGEMYLAPLEPGYYPFRIEYFHKKGEPGLSPIYMKPEGVEDFQIPSYMLYSKKN